MAEKKFRGNWNPTVSVPVQRFLPIPPPAKPKVKDAPPPRAPTPPKETQRLNRPPPEANKPGTVNIRDRNNDYRGYISPDGECVNNASQIIGYINKASGECGSSEEEYLGMVEQQVATNQLVIKDNLDEIIGTVDMGRVLFKDASGKIIAELQNTGQVYGHSGSYLGEFEGFTFRDMKTVALYLFLVDVGMTNEVEG